MEELFFQQNQFDYQGRVTNVNGLGQPWEEINQGMKNTLLLRNAYEQGKSRYPQGIVNNGSRIGVQKSQSFKQFHHRQPFKLKNNCPIPRHAQLKISRSITENSYLKCYKSRADQQGKENASMANKIKVGVSGDIINELMQVQEQNGRMLNSLSFKNSERYNYCQDRCSSNLNVIKEESQAGARMKMKSQAIRIKSFDIYPIDHSPFVSRFNNRDCISISKAANYYSEQKYQRKNTIDKLPIIRIENHLQTSKKSSLSIHASNYKQKIFLLSRLEKNNNRYPLKEQKSAKACRQQNGMGIKKYKLVLNPRLSKLKLFN